MNKNVWRTAARQSAFKKNTAEWIASLKNIPKMSYFFPPHPPPPPPRSLLSSFKMKQVLIDLRFGFQDFESAPFYCPSSCVHFLLNLARGSPPYLAEPPVILVKPPRSLPPAILVKTTSLQVASFVAVSIWGAQDLIFASPQNRWLLENYAIFSWFRRLQWKPKPNSNELFIIRWNKQMKCHLFVYHLLIQYRQNDNNVFRQCFVNVFVF